MAAVFEMEGVTVRRGGQPLVEDIEWRALPGEHWALLGANGAGKTTLLQVLTGYLWPTSGRVRIFGETLGECDVRELRRRIGFVSSNMDARLEASISALDVVGSGRYASYELFSRPGPEEREKAMDLLRRFGLARIADHPYRTLSQGERQRTLIARALMADPAVLILDEPCGGLDFPSREGVLEFISELTSGSGGGKDGPLLVYVTHYPNEIVPGITHALVLREGRIVQSGPKDFALSERALSEAYELPIRMEWTDGYPSVRVRREAR